MGGQGLIKPQNEISMCDHHGIVILTPKKDESMAQAKAFKDDLRYYSIESMLFQYR